MDLYHADIRLPDGFRLPNRVVSLFWTRHADRARLDDRYDEVMRIPLLDLGDCRVIEVGMEGKRVVKVVVRTGFTDDLDLVLVLIPGPRNWTVKTVWLNEVNDTHKTLDRSRYVA